MSHWIVYSLVCLVLALTACEAKTTVTKKVSPSLELVGVWETETPDGKTQSMTLLSDGTSRQTMSGTDDNAGVWQIRNGKGYIYWNDGWTDIITLEKGKTTIESYAPGAPLIGEPTFTGTVHKTSATKKS